MPVDRLQEGLQALGFALSAIDPAPIDDLLPIPVESDRRWLARRASTEVLIDPDLRFVRFGGLVLPDSGPAIEVDPAGLAQAVGGLVGNLLGEPGTTDPMRLALARIEGSGRVGAVVTQLELSPGFDRVAVEASLLVRTGPGRWERVAWRRGESRVAELPPGAGGDLARDPQVQTAFRMLEAIGIGRTDPRARRLSLSVGAATRIALDRARSALDADLQEAALRLDRIGNGRNGPGAR
ncbi:hypothetical protein TsocGM_16955 [Tautonia sociabilis]|uniref:Uncharacterized protein n=2 Tax=Tautonia sociabilis TaxID=2080755 RepID=A0A432MGZ7_9BACT|nr:hypothetical protein TsocGM_16955 [Tautonia sociabilis]